MNLLFKPSFGKWRTMIRFHIDIVISQSTRNLIKFDGKTVKQEDRVKKNQASSNVNWAFHCGGNVRVAASLRTNNANFHYKDLFGASSRCCRKSLNNVVIRCCLSHSETNPFDEFLCCKTGTFFAPLFATVCSWSKRYLQFCELNLHLDGVEWKKTNTKSTSTMACFAASFFHFSSHNQFQCA